MRNIETWQTVMQWRYLDKFPPRLRKDLRRFADTPVPAPEESMFIYGDVHTGKTVLAAQLMMAELSDIYLNARTGLHNRTLFVSFPDMLLDIKQTYNAPETTEDVMKKYMDAHLLVLDDFITARPTGWVVEIIYHLINYRYEQMKKTIITSNFDLAQLEQVLGEQRVTSRIARSYTIVKKQPYDAK